MNTVLALALALSLPAPTPDLQVAASTAAGLPLPELADAVARALVASGARVVLRGPTSAPCLYCASASIVETGQADYRIEVRHDSGAVSATLHLPQPSTLFDRARAIAIQTRLLMDEQMAQARRRETASSTTEHKAARKRSSEPIATTKPDQAELPELAPPSTDAVAPVAAPPPAETSASLPLKSAERKPGKFSDEPAAQPQPMHKDVAKRLAPAPTAPPMRWPWIPILTGSAAAVGAGICALVARDRYNALSDKTQPLGTAESIKNEGEHWQLASFILSGVAVAGLTTGLLGFAMRSAPAAPASAWATPVPGGAVVSLAGALP